VLATTPFAHQVNIRLQQCCVVLIGVYPATPVVCWRMRCFLPGSLLGTTGHTARSPPGLGVGVLCCHIWCSSRGLASTPVVRNYLVVTTRKYQLEGVALAGCQLLVEVPEHVVSRHVDAVSRQRDSGFARTSTNCKYEAAPSD